MENIDWNKHYNAFKLAVSKDWKHRNGLHRSIQGKVDTLVQEYDLTEREILNDLFCNYWERGHYLKYDEAKRSLNNWIAGYACFYLNNLIRRHAVRAKSNPAQKIDPLDPRNWANIEWIDRDNEKEDADYQPEIIFDPTNPEDLCIAKETLDFIHGHFRENEIAYLTGEMDLEEAAEMSGCSSEAFRRNLDRRKADFRNAMKAVDC